MKRTRGFTLIELMVVIAIFGVIAAIAVPFYNAHITRTTRAAAQQFMMDVAAREKEVLIEARAYLPVDVDTAQADFDALDRPIPNEVATYYTVTVAVFAPPAYFIITATPKAGTRQAEDFTLTLDSAGEKLSTDADGNAGWW